MGHDLNQILEVKRKFATMGIDSYGKNTIKVYRQYPQLLQELDDKINSLEKYIIESNLPNEYKEKYLGKTLVIRSDFFGEEYENLLSTQFQPSKGISLADIIKDILLGVSLGLNIRFGQNYFFDKLKLVDEDDR